MPLGQIRGHSSQKKAIPALSAIPKKPVFKSNRVILAIPCTSCGYFNPTLEYQVETVQMLTNPKPILDTEMQRHEHCHG